MKKNLQILIVLSLTAIWIQIDARSVKQELEEGVTEYVDHLEKQQETLQLLQELEKSNPEIIERIILNEQDLEATFDSIRRFINKENKKIEHVSKQATVDKTTIAQLTIELTDTQAALDKAIARYETKHKKSPKAKQALQDALAKTQESLIALAKKAQINFKQAVQYTKKELDQSMNKKNNQSRKKTVMIADVEFEVPNENTVNF